VLEPNVHVVLFLLCVKVEDCVVISSALPEQRCVVISSVEEMVNACLHEREFDHVTLPGEHGGVISIMLRPPGNSVLLPRVKFVVQRGGNVVGDVALAHVALDKSERFISRFNKILLHIIAHTVVHIVVGGGSRGVRGGRLGRVQRWLRGRWGKCGRGFRGEVRGRRARQGFDDPRRI